MPLLISIIGLAVIFAVFIAIYNRIVQLKYLAEEDWSGIDVQLKRRFDLIPNLVGIVRGYANYERGVLEQLTDIRSRLTYPSTIKGKKVYETGLSLAIKTLYVVAEAYPDLKANQNFIDLQKNISDVEGQIQYARRYYNGSARNFNVAIRTFPGNIMALLFKFRPYEFFEIEFVRALKQF